MNEPENPVIEIPSVTVKWNLKEGGLLGYPKKRKKGKHSGEIKSEAERKTMKTKPEVESVHAGGDPR